MEIEYRHLPTPFQFGPYILGTDHLHFGLFTAPDMELKEAQQLMMERLLSFFPEGTNYVLDIGTGIGGTACHMADLGYQVIGIAPNADLIDYCRKYAESRGVADKTRFEALGFEDFPWEVDPLFDVVLSQESLQYIPNLEEAIKKIAGLLRPQGKAVIGDQVIKALDIRDEFRFHVSAEIRALAEKYGMNCTHHEEVTYEAKQTIRWCMKNIKGRREEIIEHYKSHCPNIEKELEDIISNGEAEIYGYDYGKFGYELFVFDKG